MCWQTVSSLTHQQSLQQVSPPPLALIEFISTKCLRSSSGLFSLYFDYTVSEILPPRCLNMSQGLVPLEGVASQGHLRCLQLPLQKDLGFPLVPHPVPRGLNQGPEWSRRRLGYLVYSWVSTCAHLTANFWALELRPILHLWSDAI